MREKKKKPTPSPLKNKKVTHFLQEKAQAAATSLSQAFSLVDCIFLWVCVCVVSCDSRLFYFKTAATWSSFSSSSLTVVVVLWYPPSQHRKKRIDLIIPLQPFSHSIFNDQHDHGQKTKNKCCYCLTPCLNISGGICNETRQLALQQLLALERDCTLSSRPTDRAISITTTRIQFESQINQSWVV